MALQNTLFSDVCGTIDELKRRLCQAAKRDEENPAGMVEPLLKDAEFMIGRMNKRLAENMNFRQNVREIVRLLDQITEVDNQGAEQGLGFIRRCVKSRKDFRNSDVAKLCDAAEDVRLVAGTFEETLRNCKDLTLKLYDQFVAIKGKRPWLLEKQEGESLVQVIKRKYQAWLPPQPHCDKLLEFLGASRAYVLEEPLPDGQPVVQFEDGGVMPMALVRWDEDVKNFHPAYFKPRSDNVSG